jgi:uncharacterized protein YkwD
MAGVRTAPWWGETLHAAPDTNRLPTGTVSPCLGGSTCITADELPVEPQHLIALVAGERARAGCATVALDSRLQRAAQEYADAMAAGHRPSHIDTEQRTPQDRAAAAGYHGRVQENLAVGLGTADEVLTLWLDNKVDPSLRTRLDNCSAKAMGLGHSAKKAGDAYGPGIWVLVLGQPESA